MIVELVLEIFNIFFPSKDKSKLLFQYHQSLYKTIIDNKIFILQLEDIKKNNIPLKFQDNNNNIILKSEFYDKVIKDLNKINNKAIEKIIILINEMKMKDPNDINIAIISQEIIDFNKNYKINNFINYVNKIFNYDNYTNKKITRLSFRL